jgi:DNA-binding beta-propeller fold protein YncE
VRPTIEALEGRLLPSTFAVVNTADSGSGSLRQALLDSNASTGPNTIIFNVPGGGAHTIQPLSALPSLTRSVVLDGTSQPGYSGSPLIEVNSSLVITAGAPGSVVEGLVLDGITLQGSNSVTIKSNYIGTDVTGTQASGRGGGIFVGPGSRNTVIGGAAAGDGNLISAGSGVGIDVNGRFGLITGTVIEGNFIGTDVSGAAALGNGGQGIRLFNIIGTQIGGTAAGAGNLISANGGAGIQLAADSGTVVQGNTIGTDVTGTAALGNGGDGINDIAGEVSLRIGGAAAGAGNLISGNAGNGVRIFGDAPDQITSNCTIAGNFIGTDATGANALGNGLDGLFIGGNFGSGATRNVTVGGAAAGAGNLISGNGGSGVEVSGADVLNLVVAGNLIGTDGTGTQPLGNAAQGVSLASASGALVGGTGPGEANTIAFNGNDGVLVDTGTHNAIRENSIFSSGNLGVELANNGNDNQAAPVLTSAVSDGSSSVTIRGTLTAAANTTYALDFFANATANSSGFGEGQQFLGTGSVTTNAGGSASFTFLFAVGVPAGQAVSATATAPNGDTSAFAADIVTTTGPVILGSIVVAPSGEAINSIAVNPATDNLYLGRIVDNNTADVAVVNASDPTNPSVVTAVPGGFYQVTANPVTNRYYTTDGYGGHVLVYNGTTNALVASVFKGYCHAYLDTDPTTNLIYTESQCGSFNDPVQVLDGATNSLVAGPLGSGGVASGVEVNPATGRVYAVVGELNNTRVFGPAPSFTFLHDLAGLAVAVNPVTNRLYFDSGSDLQVFDGSSDTLLATIPGAAGPRGGVAVNTNLDRIYVADSADGVVKIIDGGTNAGIGSFSLGANVTPYQLAVNSNEGLVYVAGRLANGTTKLFVVRDSAGGSFTPGAASPGPGSPAPAQVGPLGGAPPAAPPALVGNGGHDSGAPAGAGFASALPPADPLAVRALVSGPVPADGLASGTRPVEDAPQRSLTWTGPVTLSPAPAELASVRQAGAPKQDGADLLFAALATGGDGLGLHGLWGPSGLDL